MARPSGRAILSQSASSDLPDLMALEDAQRTGETVPVQSEQVADNSSEPVPAVTPVTGVAVETTAAPAGTYGPVRLRGFHDLGQGDVAWVNAKIIEDLSRGRVNRAPYFLDMMNRNKDLQSVAAAVGTFVWPCFHQCLACSAFDADVNLPTCCCYAIY